MITKPEAENIISLAYKHLNPGGMHSSAKLCLDDALRLFDAESFESAYLRARKSLAYSVGILHPDYPKEQDDTIDQANKKSYAELMEFVAEKGKEYLTTEEYKALYPILVAKYKSEGHAAKRKTIRKWRSDIKRETIQSGIPVGLFL